MFKPSDLSLWKGRIDTDSAGDARRIHEVVRAYDDTSAAGSSVVLLGFCSDEGVRRNLGRVGAKDGPAAIRAALAPLAWRAGDTLLFDGGDLVCEGDQLEQLHGELSTRVQELISAGHLPIVIGGGHEVAFGTGSGVLAAFPAPAKIGIINIDAHLDLRTPPTRNSGSSFADLAACCAEDDREFSYLCLGASESSNSEALWSRAKSLQATCIIDLFVRENWAKTRELCRSFIDRCDRIYLSVDMDVHPSHEAPGVSAPASLGVPTRCYRLCRKLSQVIS
jgi:formiminoglutamase